MQALIAANALAAQSELRAAREALGWTQQQLGEACGLPATLVCSVERGAADRMAAAMRGPLRERVAAALDADEYGDPYCTAEDALAALRGLRRVQS